MQQERERQQESKFDANHTSAFFPRFVLLDDNNDNNKLQKYLLKISIENEIEEEGIKKKASF